MIRNTESSELSQAAPEAKPEVPWYQSLLQTGLTTVGQYFSAQEAKTLSKVSAQYGVPLAQRGAAPLSNGYTAGATAGFPFGTIIFVGVVGLGAFLLFSGKKKSRR